MLCFFKINKLVTVVLFYKSFDQLVFMFTDPPCKVIGKPHIHNPVVPVCDQISIIVSTLIYGILVIEQIEASILTKNKAFLFILP
jgi:hypothetical protein